MRKSRLNDFISPAEREALWRPPGSAEGLPASAYGPDFFSLEQRELFPHEWCVVGFASDIPSPGDALPIDLAGWPLLLVRGEDSLVRVFHNVCRHRGNRIVDTACTGLNRLVCPWHAWGYDLEGRLVSTPRIGGERKHFDPAFDTSELNLKAVRSSEWLDYVVVNIDGAAPALEAHIRPLEVLLERYDFSDLEAGESWSIDYPGNWKLSVEGAIEDYHLPAIHGELVRGVIESRYRLDYSKRCYFANSTQRDAAGGYEALVDTRDRAVKLPSFLRSDDEPRTYAINVFPNGFITATPQCLHLWVLHPRDARHTHIETRHFYRRGVMQNSAFIDIRRRLVDLWRLTLEQDQGVIANVQSNMERPVERGIKTRFSPFWEANVQRFQQSVVLSLLEAENYSATAPKVRL